ncbi:MAG: hypothetical protein QOG73_3940 [Acetobacteraceae bacterium]|nr:hypothetical protein [Acetobacteraceae bacterium]
MSIIRAVIVAGFLISACAYAEQQNDLREFRVGMPISALPESGYAAFACASDPAKKLSGWGGHQTCPAHADGTRAISFRYGNGGSPEDDDGGKTQVGGQPVNLALLIAKDGPGNGLVAGIRVDTDPHARLYMHKKAYLFALQVRARFGVKRRHRRRRNNRLVAFLSMSTARKRRHRVISYSIASCSAIRRKIYATSPMPPN